MSRTINAKRNIFYGLINQFISLLLPFIVRTVIIKKLGIEYLGLNNLFSSILQVLSLAELGFGSAIVFNMYEPIAKNNTEMICKLLNLYRTVYKYIGIIVFLIGIVIMPLLPKLIKGTALTNINIQILYLIYLVNTVLSYLLFAYKSSLLVAYQRADCVSVINIIAKLFLNIGQIIVLIYSKNYYFFLLLMPLSTIINNLISNFLVSKLFPDIKPKGKLEYFNISKIKKNIYGLMINKVCQVSRNSFDSIVITSFLGLSISAMYSNYYYVMNAIVLISTVITTSITASIGNSIATESVEKNYCDFNKINFIYMWVSGWATICLICLYQPFMKIWVGENYLFDNNVVFLFGIYFYFLKMGDIKSLYSEASGLWWQNKNKAILESILNLFLNILLGYFFGIYGILIATIITILFVNFGMGSKIVFLFYFKNNHINVFFRQQFNYFIVTVIIGIICYEVTNIIILENILGVMFKFIICMIIPNIFYFIFYRKKDNFILCKNWIKYVLHTK